MNSSPIPIRPRYARNASKCAAAHATNRLRRVQEYRRQADALRWGARPAWVPGIVVRHLD